MESSPKFSSDEMRPLSSIIALFYTINPIASPVPVHKRPSMTTSPLAIQSDLQQDQSSSIHVVRRLADDQSSLIRVRKSGYHQFTIVAALRTPNTIATHTPFVFFDSHTPSPPPLFSARCEAAAQRSPTPQPVAPSRSDAPSPVAVAVQPSSPPDLTPHFFYLLLDTLWQLSLRSMETMESGPYPVRDGEPDCSYYIRTGLRRFGAYCRFNHPSNKKLCMAVDNSQSQAQEDPPLPNIPIHPEPEPYEQQHQTLEQLQNDEQPTNEQQGSDHEQPHYNGTPIADLVVPQQVQTIEQRRWNHPPRCLQLQTLDRETPISNSNKAGCLVCCSETEPIH
nr:zinc finger CCCH domain-containing protein ZFN-like isoform X1 [Ipomoea batatas]